MKFDIKEKYKEIKAFVDKLDKKIKIIALSSACAIVLIAVITAIILNNKTFVPIFIDIANDEASEIVSYLQSEGIEYKYKGDGTILVEESVADKTRANLVYEGYPSSGFTYDIYIKNAGGMTTDSEKETYKLYELQNRIGATIELFDNVKDAKVTIALADDKKYVLQSDAEQSQSKASVVVTMKSGSSLEPKQAKAIQRLVSSNVANMQMENVTVYDQNGIELSLDTTEQGTNTTEVELANIIENKIEQKIANILSPFYGEGNIRVSANGKINMEKVIRETTTYNTPEKINQNDKTGIVSKEQGSETNGSTDTTGQGTAGTETNTEIPEYNQQGENQNDNYSSNTYNREYLVNTIKEQTQIDPGMMDDLSVAISINGVGYGSLNANQIRELAANATGIELAQADQKITVVAAPFYEEAGNEVARQAQDLIEKYWWVLTVIGILILLVVVGIILIKRKLKKRRLAKEKAFEMPEQIVPEPIEINKDNNIDILNMKNKKSRELRENIREFVNTNPEISAQMLRSWLNGGEQSDGN